MAKAAKQTQILGVTVSHPDKILFPKDGITKLEVVNYYAEAAALMLPEMKNRPLMLSRCPGRFKCFYQKNFEEKIGGLKTARVRETGGGINHYVYVTKESDIVQLAQLNTIEFHAWGSRVPDTEKPDRMVFDIDPDTSMSAANVVAFAKKFKDFLSGFKLITFPRVSGGKGLHLVIPISPAYSFDEMKEISKSLALRFAEMEPLAIVKASKADRIGKIFIDYLRNGRGSTCVTNFSLRSREGAPAAVPVSWTDVTARIKFNQFSLRTRSRWMPKKADAWEDINKLKQKLPSLAQIMAK